MFSRLSLKYRIALIIFLLEAVMLSVVLLQSLGHSYEETSELISNQEVVIAELVSGMGRPALITEEYEELQPYVEDLIVNSEATRLFLADSNRIVIVSSDPAYLGIQMPQFVDREDHRWLVREINNAAGLLGILAIEFSTAELDAAYSTAREFGIGIALVGMLLIAGVGIVVGILLTKRLEVITHTAHQVAAGDYSARTGLTQQDELGRLAHTFDQMTASLQHKAQDLRSSLVALQNREKDLAITLNSIGDAVVATNAAGEVTQMNPVAERLTGWDFSEARGLPLSQVFPIINTITRQPVENPVDKVISTGKVIHLSNHTTLIDRQGKEYHIADSAAPIRDRQGEIKGVVLVFNDVSEQYLLREKARGVQEQLQGLLKEMQTMVAILDPQGRIQFINDMPLTIFGLRAKQVQNRDISEIGLFADDESLCEQIRESVVHASHGSSVQHDMRFETRQGPIWVDFNIHPVFNAGGKVTNLLVEGRDITQRKQAEEKIFYQANFDELTGLPNRFLSLDRLSQLMTEARRSEHLVAVLFVDLDDFKKVNDSMGHEMGDKLLIKASERFKESIRAGDTIGRLGGDEFIILLPGIKHSMEVQAVAENLLNRFRTPFLIDNREFTLTLSIGIAVFPEDGSNPSDILRNSDTAMYHAKEHGRNTYFYYAEHMNESVARRLAIEEQMHGAIERGEFTVHYQPQVELISGEISAAEALLRWDNPALGGVSPFEFIPIAEQTGFIMTLGRFVMGEALRQTRQWQKDINPEFKISVNLSPNQFRDAELVEFIKQSLKDYELQGRSLELEITEGVLMNGHRSVDKALAKLSKLGVSIALDDFGTGYASLSYLRRYPFEVLKVDKSFVKDIDVDPADKELITAAIAMAHGMNLQVVAEGVETQRQLDLLMELGCDFAQGFFLGRPMRAAALSELLTNPRQLLTETTA